MIAYTLSPKYMWVKISCLGRVGVGFSGLRDHHLRADPLPSAPAANSQPPLYDQRGEKANVF